MFVIVSIVKNRLGFISLLVRPQHDRQTESVDTDSRDTLCPLFPVGKHASIKRGLQPRLEEVLAQQHSD